MSTSVTFDGFTFERPGHATVRVETDGGTVLYFDPWEEVLDVAPSDADYVLVSHDDRDHYDPAAIEMVASHETTVIAYDVIDTSQLEDDLGLDVVRLPADSEVEVGDLHVRAVPAYNRPEGRHVRPNGEPYHPEGTVIGLVVTLEDVTIYFTSDTDALPILGAIEADVLIPPIGGRPTMDRHEAADLARRIRPELVLPVHYNSELVPDIQTDAEAFAAELEADGIRVELF